VIGVAFLLELAFLNGRQKIGSSYAVDALLVYD